MRYLKERSFTSLTSPTLTPNPMKTLLLTLLTLTQTASAADQLAKGFAQPPPSARPWVYWFPLNGNITSNGITADLEAMQRVGIGGVLYMEVDQGAPKGPADFAGPLWRDLIKHACQEAHRLGLEINMNNDAGWCGSGGPWITPELSMQKFTTSEVLVEGPKRFEGLLPVPPMVKDFYQDIGVLAFPTPAGDEVRMSAFSPKVTTSAAGPKVKPQTLVDGKSGPPIAFGKPERNKPQWIQVEFPQPFAARSLTITAAGGDKNAIYGALQISEDGQKFKTVRDFTIKPPQSSVGFEPVSSRWYRIQFSRTDARLAKLAVSEIELSPRFRIENIAGKASFVMGHFPAQAATFPSLDSSLAIQRDRIIDVTARMDKAGKLAWEVPAGKWTIMRMGHTTTGKDNHPAPESGRGLECDKLSKQAAEAHFNGLMAKVISDSKPLAGKTLVTTHIDSWEVGSQNWTPRMREEFQQRRGYDLFRFLPVFTGRVVDSVEISERFLWDLRQTVSDLIVENYAGHIRKLANEHGLRLSIEAYGEPADNLAYAGEADEPMGEFWSWGKFGGAGSCTQMGSAAHVYGKPIVGAEAFTANNEERWQGHPGNIKDLGDWAFCEGINRFVFHRYALQPWTNPDHAPGMSMGPWGLHYERTQTWWEQSKAWHEYLARCQFLLQQGLFVADICYLQPEGAPRAFTPPADAETQPYTRPGYNYDGCSVEAVLKRMSVKDGRIVLPDGMNYRVLALPESETMTPRLLRKVKELADAGATIVASKAPVKAPGLEAYPQCDAEVQKVAGELWNNGKIVTGKTAAETLAKLGVPPDFATDRPLRHIHRRIGDLDVYFVANGAPQAVDATCKFRVTGKQPELWHPETGQMERAAAFSEANGCTGIPLRFESFESVFVIFRKDTEAIDPILTVVRDGKPLFPKPEQNPRLQIQKAVYGVLDDPKRTRDVRAKVQALVDAGTNRFRVSLMAKGGDPAFMVVKTLVVDYTADGKSYSATGTDPETIRLSTTPSAEHVADVRCSAKGQLAVEAWQPGRYEVKTVAGKSRVCEVPTVPAPEAIAGPWKVRFDPKWGGPDKITFEKLEDWSKRLESGIRYYSGTAVYEKSFSFSPKAEGPSLKSKYYLELGQVEVMADVKLNGKVLGILWKAPYRVDVTDALKADNNDLELKVVNLWINRQIGDEQLPEDSDRRLEPQGRKPGGTLNEWPKWVWENKPSPSGRYAFSSWRLWQKNDPLVPSGLIGPVTIRTVQVAEIR